MGIMPPDRIAVRVAVAECIYFDKLRIACIPCAAVTNIKLPTTKTTLNTSNIML